MIDAGKVKAERLTQLAAGLEWYETFLRQTYPGYARGMAIPHIRSALEVLARAICCDEGLTRHLYSLG